jgi:hypothetical protein
MPAKVGDWIRSVSQSDNPRLGALTLQTGGAIRKQQRGAVVRSSIVRRAESPRSCHASLTTPLL